MRSGIFVATGLLIGALASNVALATEQKEEMANKQASIVAGELGTIATYLQTHPEMVLDFTHVSGEYCLNTWKANGSHMTHFAVDPSATSEDVIDFVKADELIGAGVDVEGLPRLPGKLGAMEPGHWYFLPANEFEPHHGTAFPMALLVRASNIE